MSDPARLSAERAALAMAASWMGARYYRTFRLAEDASGDFDALITQRERRIGVTIATLWDPEGAPEHHEFEDLLTADLEEEEGGYAVWLPPGAGIPDDEPARSELRILLANGLKGLDPEARREVRIPVTLQLAKIQADGAYVSVAGGLSSAWTTISEGIEGAYHLDSRPLHRLPEEPAELDIIGSRVRDRAELLAAGEVSAVPLHDYWLLSRLPGDAPTGVTLVGAPPRFSPLDGSLTRRLFRRAVARAVSQRAEREVDLAVLLVITAIGHMEEELVTAALRGMSPATYGSLDLIALVGDGQVRQVLQPRSLPW